MTLPLTFLRAVLRTVTLATLAGYVASGAFAHEEVTGVDPKLAAPAEEPMVQQRDIAAYRDEIYRLEIAEGPYSNNLSQQLLGLGDIYSAQGDHLEAIRHFKRAIHVSRINLGLNSLEQIPIAERLAASYVSIGDVEEADNRKRYLYRIALESYPTNDPRRAIAMVEFADWQRQTYLAGVGKTPYLRLLHMYDIYQNALRLVASTHEDYSLGLLVPLNGLLSAHYLLSTHKGERSMTHRTLRSSAGEEGASSQETRVEFLRQMSFKQGKATLVAMRAIHENNPISEPHNLAEVSAAMGDWLLWHGKQSGANNAYKQAWTETEELEDRDAQRQRLFGNPIELPMVVDLTSGLEHLYDSDDEESGPEWARIQITVNERGKVSNMEVLESHPEEKSRRLSRVLRNLRSTRFRPSYVEGEAAVSQIVRRYEY
jgi:tetratricopeptide (TPR) repeat protein